MDSMQLNLTNGQIQKIQYYAKVLHKDPQVVLDSALEHYFTAQDEILQKQDASQTDLGFDEFWDGVEI